MCGKPWKDISAERTAACQQNHGGSLARAFDLICRSAVMLWHFRHNSGLGQTNYLWYGKLAHFTFLPSPCSLGCLIRCLCMDVGEIVTIPLKIIDSANCDVINFYFFASFFSFLLLLFFPSLHAYISFQWEGLKACVTSFYMWDVWAKLLCHQLY